MDVIVIDWERGLVGGSYIGKMNVSIIEQGDLLLNTVVRISGLSNKFLDFSVTARVLVEVPPLSNV